MAERIAAHPWADTAVGPREGWPAARRTALDLCVCSRFPVFVWWGPERISFHNDAYAPFLGGRHPATLGRPAAGIWHEIWDVLAGSTFTLTLPLA